MDQTISTVFDQREVFAKLRQHNRMCHEAVYPWLAGYLAGRSRDDLRLLDLGCNDARDMARVLAAGDVATYTGVDTDTDFLATASRNLAGSPACVSLLASDALDALGRCENAVDTIWMGLLLHHFPVEAKARLFQLARTALSQGGCLLTHDPMPSDGENSDAFLERFGREVETNWTELTTDERRVLMVHWSRHGRHDPIDVVKRLALDAGFRRVRRKVLDVAGLYALLRFEV